MRGTNGIGTIAFSRCGKGRLDAQLSVLLNRSNSTTLRPAEAISQDILTTCVTSNLATTRKLKSVCNSARITLESVTNTAISRDSAVFVSVKSLFSRFCPQIISFQDFRKIDQIAGRITPAGSMI